MNINEDMYNKCHVLSQREDIILEAKRVLLNEDIEKMLSTTFSEYQADVGIKISTKECKQTLPWSNEEFWKDVSNPNNKLTSKQIIEESISEIKYNSVVLLNQINDVQKRAKAVLNTKKRTKKQKQTLKMYFDKWHLSTIRRRETRKIKAMDAENKGKVDTFLKNIKILQGKQQNSTEKLKAPTESRSESSSAETSKQKVSLSVPNSRNSTGSDKTCSESYKNRFKAQKNIIDEQKAKLEAQNKIIEELKLGIIKEDLVKTIDDSKVSIQEIFSKCSTKLKCVVIPGLDVVETERIDFMLKSQKAPKIVQQMERRALERALKREIILERKRLMEEAKKKLIEEAIEKKRLQDEEEKKKNLEMMKERRRKELELEKVRQKNKQIFQEKLGKSENLHKKLLLRNYFGKLKTLYLQSKINMNQSKQHYNTKVLRSVMENWLNIIEIKYRIKNNIADGLYKGKLLLNYFHCWKEIHLESRRSLQVADDFYDLCLQNNTFVHWHRYTCCEIIAVQKKTIIAEEHYKRWLVFHYFYLWRSLPAVLQLEKAKEAKKKRWREKVWEVLPDYKPPGEDEFYL